MRRQRRTEYEDDYNPIFNNNAKIEDFMQMESLSRNATTQPTQPHRFENTIEAKVQDGDTLQALALRFHCTVADIKRLNKIDRENEIHARKVIKIPLTVHSVLLGTTLPAVHKSGNNSPTHSPPMNRNDMETHIMRNPLKDAQVVLSEKLMVASVNSSGNDNSNATVGHVNNLSLNSKTSGGGSLMYHDEAEENDAASPLILHDRVPQPVPIRGPALSAIDWSGSDCDMSWVCLFVIILALCFVIPLIYVIYLAEHPHTTTSH